MSDGNNSKKIYVMVIDFIPIKRKNYFTYRTLGEARESMQAFAKHFTESTYEIVTEYADAIHFRHKAGGDIILTIEISLAENEVD